ncbi:MAG: hypothetical protein ACFE9C_15760 [Candidatus Hodarchaeota archaeon]
MSTYHHRPWATWVILFILLISTACTTQITPEASQPITIDPTQKPVQTDTAVKTTITEEELEILLREVLIGDLKDVIFDHDGEPGMLFICWDIQAAYSNELIADGAKEDTLEILRTVVESDVEYDEVHISGWYPMTVDINNTIEDTEVISLFYDRATLEGRNWDTIRTQYIWWIAGRGFVNKELQR